MKLVVIDGGAIGLLVELPAGPHVIDLANSLGALAGHDLVSGGLINGALKEKSVWTALVANWQYLRLPLARLAGIAVANPDHPCLVLRRLADCRQSGDTKGIVALDITYASYLAASDPTNRLVVAREFAEPVVEPAERDEFSLAENVQVIDFSRRSDGMTQSLADSASGQFADSLADVVPFPRPNRVREKVERSGLE
jgi:hypothetical protein